MHPPAGPKGREPVVRRTLFITEAQSKYLDKLKDERLITSASAGTRQALAFWMGKLKFVEDVK